MQVAERSGLLHGPVPECLRVVYGFASAFDCLGQQQICEITANVKHLNDPHKLSCLLLENVLWASELALMTAWKDPLVNIQKTSHFYCANNGKLKLFRLGQLR